MPELVTVTLRGLSPLDVVVDALLYVSVETPELPSLHVNVTVTSSLVVVPGTYGIVPAPEGIVAEAVTVGATESIHTCLLTGDSTLPAMSDAKYAIVVLPWAETVTDLEAPGTTVSELVWAPVEENAMSFTPETSSVAVSAIATDPLAQSPNA